MEIQLDVNFGFRPEGAAPVALCARSAGAFLARSRYARARELCPRAPSNAKTPIASLESIHGVTNYRPYFEAGAADVAIIDVVWNGFLESVRIANLADTYEINVAPHNFYGHLASAMSAHFCAAVPNFRIMEYEADDVPWKDELFTHQPTVEDGMYVLSTAPRLGHGCE